MPTLYTHPFYTDRKPHWTKWRDMYEGDHDTMVRDAYLWRHQIENDQNEGGRKLRTLREQRTRYLNLIEILVSLWTSYFFQKEPAYDNATLALLGEAKDDIDGQGTSFFSFIKEQILRDFLLYGRTITLVSKPDFQARTMKEYKDAGVRPIIEQVNPLSFFDWDLNEYGSTAGQFRMARHEFEMLEPRYSAEQEPKTKTHCHAYAQTAGAVSVRKYTLEKDDKGKVTFDKNGNADWLLVGEFPLDLAQIPCVMTDCDSWVRDAAEEALRFHNLRSNKDNIDYIQGYQRLVAKGVDFGNSEQLKALTEYTISGIPETGDLYAIEPAQTTALQESIVESLDNVFKVGLNLFRSLPADSRLVQGADTLSQERANAYALVRSSLEEIERHVNRVVEHWAAFEGKKDFEAHIELDKEISESGFDELIKTYQAFADKIDRSAAMSQKVDEKLAARLGVDPDELKKDQEAAPPQQERPAQSPLDEALNADQQRRA